MKIVEEAVKPLAINPKKFAMWLFVASIAMLFAAFTSAYLVRQAEGNWLIFELPTLFWTNTLVILVSSLTLHSAYWAVKRDQLEWVKWGVLVTFILGMAFLVGQYMAWGKMVEQKVYFVGNPSGSFVYVISGLHGLHIVGGLVFLLIVLFNTFKYKIHSQNRLQMEMCITYWHFLGALWLYLFIFLHLNR